MSKMCQKFALIADLVSFEQSQASCFYLLPVFMLS